MAQQIDPDLATPGEWVVVPTHMTMFGGDRFPTYGIVATKTEPEHFIARTHPKNGLPEERPILEMDARLFAASKAMATLLLQALAYEEDAFDNDESVDGGDLVDFFAGWRQDVRRLLEITASSGRE